MRVSHVIHACSERHSSTLSSPFHPTSSFHHSLSISCSPSCTSSTSLRTVVTLRIPPKRRWSRYDDSYLPTGYEPKNYDLMETYVESLTESLTQPPFSEQRFLEDVDYDDTALEEMLHNAHRVHVYHSQREGLSVGQSSSSVSERTERPVVERTGRPVVASGQELNVEHAQIRTLLDRQKEQILAECQAEIDYDRRSVQQLSDIIESQQEELHCVQAEELQRRDQQLLHAQLLQQN